MKKEIKILVAIFFVVSVLGLGVAYLSNPKFTSAGNVLSPYASSFNIFSFMLKKEKPKYIIYGYLPYWTLDQTSYFQLDKLTDIAYFGLNIDAKGDFIKIGDDGNVDPGYDKWKNSDALNALIAESKKQNVRFALTIISHVDDVSDKFLDCRSCWDNLIQNTKTELRSKGITDVNLNFEYAEYTDGDRAEKYAQFVKVLNDELDKSFGSSFVVVSTFADSIVKERVTSKVDELGKAADGIFIMGYDFHRPNSDTAGPVAPLDGIGVTSDYDIRTMVNDYLTKAPPNKIIVGVPYYGYNWGVTTTDPYAKRNDLVEGEANSESQTYASVMDTILDKKPDVKWDNIGQVPYFTYTRTDTGELREVYFENVDSLKKKYDFFKEKNLGGVGIWALGYDEGYDDLWKLLYDEFVK